jgi:hypothetical protein
MPIGRTNKVATGYATIDKMIRGRFINGITAAA